MFPSSEHEHIICELVFEEFDVVEISEREVITEEILYEPWGMSYLGNESGGYVRDYKGGTDLELNVNVLAFNCQEYSVKEAFKNGNAEFWPSEFLKIQGDPSRYFVE